MIVLKLNNVEVQHANFLPVLNIAGFPAITSFTGFANAIAFKYGKNNAPIIIINNGAEIEYGTISQYGVVNLNKVAGVNTHINTSNKKIQLSDQPSATGYLNMTFYIYLDDDIYNDVHDDIISGKLKHELLTKFRVAGGVISKIGELDVIQNEIDVITNIQKANKTGYFVCDERNQLENIENDENIFNVAARKIFDNQSNNRELKNSDTILSLTSVGFYLLEEPTSRDGARNELKHAYAEPLIGLISFKKVGKFDFDKDELPIWEYVKENNIVVSIN